MIGSRSTDGIPQSGTTLVWSTEGCWLKSCELQHVLQSSWWDDKNKGTRRKSFYCEGGSAVQWLILLTRRPSREPGADGAWVGSNPIYCWIPRARNTAMPGERGLRAVSPCHPDACTGCSVVLPVATPSTGTTPLRFNTKPSSICETSTQHLYFTATCLVLVIYSVLFNLGAIWAGKLRIEWNAFLLLI